MCRNKNLLFPLKIRWSCEQHSCLSCIRAAKKKGFMLAYFRFKNSVLDYKVWMYNWSSFWCRRSCNILELYYPLWVVAFIDAKRYYLYLVWSSVFPMWIDTGRVEFFVLFLIINNQNASYSECCHLCKLITLRH